MSVKYKIPNAEPLTKAQLGEANEVALNLAVADTIGLVPLKLTVECDPMVYTAKGEHKAIGAKDIAYLSMPISPPSEGIGPAMRTEHIQPVLPPMASAVGGR